MLTHNSPMASVRLPCSPSSIYNHHRNFRTKSLSVPSSSLHINFQSNGFNKVSFSWSTFNSSCNSGALNINEVSKFFLCCSSTIQDPVIDSSETLQEPGLEPNGQEEKEEFSTIRLVAQNVPWTCTAEDIRGLFEKFGTVIDVELSMYNKTRNRGLAFVTMSSPEEALAALNSLQSYEFEGRTLYVNYAKLKMKSSPPASAKPAPTFNLFVANIHFEARAKDLREFFQAEGADVVTAEIIFYDNPRKSSGYGFVAFRTKKEADEALAAFQGKDFKGRPLRVARSKQFVRQTRKEAVDFDESVSESTPAVEDSATEELDAAEAN